VAGDCPVEESFDPAAAAGEPGAAAGFWFCAAVRIPAKAIARIKAHKNGIRMNRIMGLP
jgi:hypothetical protein